MKKLINFIFLSFISISITSCLDPKQADQIGDNLSFPVKMLSLNSNEFLLLNSNAANSYNSGSIHRYKLDQLGNPSLQKVYLMPSHGSDIVLNDNASFMAFALDSSAADTQITFYDYSNQDALVELPHLTLHFAQTQAKQAIKQLKFFKVDGYDEDFLYGVILTSPQDTGEGRFIPSRTFVAKVSRDRSSSEILFVLSYAVGDNINNIQTIAQKSNSIKAGFKENFVQYMFGSTAPLYDPVHGLFIAFPTGSMNGFNDKTLNAFPALPLALNYFGAQANPSTPCPVNDPNCALPDMRTVSLFAVDMKSFLSGTPLNLSLYFVPLAWNMNGIPFGHKTNNSVINFGAADSTDVNSFKFQSDFWATYRLDSNTLLVGKKGFDTDNETALGNEIYQISGISTLYANIQKINKQLPASQFSGNDFAQIAHRQIIDTYHTLNFSDNPLSFDWPVNNLTGLRNPGPLLPYIYSRTVNAESKEIFTKAPTAVYNFGTVCLTSTACYPYWLRATYVPTTSNNYGLDSSWLTTQIPSISYEMGQNPTFQDSPYNPTSVTSYTFKSLTGAQVCTTLEKDIYCTSFLNGEFTKFHFDISTGFSPF